MKDLLDCPIYKADLAYLNRFVVQIDNMPTKNIIDPIEIASFEEKDNKLIVGMKLYLNRFHIIEEMSSKKYGCSPKWFVKKKDKFNITVSMMSPNSILLNEQTFNNCVLRNIIKPEFSYVSNEPAVYKFIFQR